MHLHVHRSTYSAKSIVSIQVYFGNFRFLGCIFMLMLLTSLLPLSLIFMTSFLYIFLNNDEFRKGKN